MEAAEVSSKFQTCDGPASFSEESRLALSGKNKKHNEKFVLSKMT